MMLPRLFVEKHKDYGYCYDFEERLSKYFGKDALLTPNGRTGLETILKAYNIKRKDKVLLSSFNATSVVDTVKRLARPVFLDPNPKTMNLEQVRNSGARFLIVLHSEGNPSDMKKIARQAEGETVIIEDCAQSFGSRIHGKKTGTFGDAAFFSFGHGKMINSLGGGAIIVDKCLRERAQEQILCYRNRSYPGLLLNSMKNNILHEMTKRRFFSLFISPFLGEKDWISCLFEDRGKKPRRMHEKQFPMGVWELSRIERKILHRRKRAFMIMKGFDRGLFPAFAGEPNFQSLPFFSGDNESFRKHMLHYGIDVQKTWLRGFADGSKLLEKTVACLPVHEQVTRGDIEKIREGIRDYKDNPG